jgi:dipeptidyl aminopeptidase/acylaminoacyl peptidase
VKPKVKFAVTGALVLSAAVIVFINWRYQSQSRPTVARPPSPSQSQPNQVNTYEPLQIEAIRQRSYPGSDITIEQNLGNQGGYSTQIVSYRSDGLKIYALLATPVGTKPEGGWPVVILNHGYINPTEYQTNGSSYRGVVAALARAGFMVIKPDYRGNGNSQGQPEGGHFSPVYTYDVLNLIASLKHYPEANTKRLGMIGHSMGGHVSLRTIVVSPDIKATVLWAGVVGSMNDFFYNWPNSPFPKDQPTALVQGTRQALVDKYGTPATNPGFWDSVSSINFVSAISGVVQVDHGTGDTVVPELFSDHLVAALNQAGKSVTYYTYPGDDHNLSHNQSLFLSRVIAFYRSKL